MSNDNPRLHVNRRDPQPAETWYVWEEPTPYPFKFGVLVDALAQARADGAPDNANVQISGDRVMVNWTVVEDEA